jgi:lauroyl/myristoyl acyltransferase
MKNIFKHLDHSSSFSGKMWLYYLYILPPYTFFHGNGSHIGWFAVSSDISLKTDTQKMIQANLIKIVPMDSEKIF